VNLSWIKNPELDGRYPRTAGYDPAWVAENAAGSHCLQLMELLADRMDLAPGMRVLDLGCGKGIDAIFLAREFGVQVWAADTWFSPTETWRRVEEAGCRDLVFPLKAEARDLPFPERFFDAVVGVNSFQYFATDDYFLHRYLLPVLRPGGRVGIIVPGTLRDFTDEVPGNLLPSWDPGYYSWHTVDWWARHWVRTGQVDVLESKALEDGHRIFRDFQRAIEAEDPLIEADLEGLITFLRIVVEKTAPEP